MQESPPKVASSLSLEFETWTPDAPTYADVDAKLRVRLTTLQFFGNRPTIGALMGIGGDLSAAFKGVEDSGKIKGNLNELEATDETEEDQSEASSDIASGTEKISGEAKCSDHR